MQDSRDYTSGEFINNSWKDMASLLDEQMPVVVNNNGSTSYKWAVLLLSSLLMLTTLSAIYFATKEISLPEPITKEVIKEKIVYQNIYIDKTEIAELDKKGFSSNGAASEIVAKASEDKVSTFQNEPSLETASSTGVEIQGSDAAANNNLIPFVSVASLVPLDRSLTTAQRQLKLENEDSFKSEIQEIKRNITVELGVLMTATTDRDFSGLGVSSNINLPIAKRFDLSTGLGLNYFDRDNYFVEPFARGDEKTNPKNPDEIQYQNLRTFKQIYVPISLGYALTESFAINSGVKLRYTYSHEVDQSIPLPSTTSLRRPTNISDQSVFNNTNVGVSAGLRYKFNPHLSIMVDSEFGVSSFMNMSLFNNPSKMNYNLNIVNFKTNYTF